jgi:hypothetical protein
MPHSVSKASRKNEPWQHPWQHSADFANDDSYLSPNCDESGKKPASMTGGNEYRRAALEGAL